MIPRERRERVLDSIVALLEDEPMALVELAAHVPITLRWVREYVKLLLKGSPKRIHVCGWRRNSPGSPSRLYAAGDQPDAPKPKPRTNTELYRERRMDPEVRAVETERKRVRRMRGKVAKHTSIVSSILIGVLHGNDSATRKQRRR